jgi:hypothetical protein
MSRLFETVLNALGGCLGVRKGETVLILCDSAGCETAAALSGAARELGASVRLIEIPPGQWPEGAPPETVADMMKRSTVLVLLLTRPDRLGQALGEAVANGARAAVMTGVDAGCLLRAMDADYTKIARRSRRIASLFSSGGNVHITSPSGTDLEFRLNGRTARADTGILHQPGESGEIPGGQVIVEPLADSAGGKLVLDSSPEWPGGMTVHLEPSQKGMARLNTMGIGMNDKARIDSHVGLERQKAPGAVRLVLENPTRTDPAACDCLLTKATLRLDGRLIVKDGALAV